MELILLENIINLGNIGDKVEVKPGYGRNFLLKTGKALRLNKENLEYVSLLNLKELKNIFYKNFNGDSRVTFLPAKLKKTAQTSTIRKIVVFLISNRILGSIFLYIINKLFIGIMPYHVIIAKKR